MVKNGLILTLLLLLVGCGGNLALVDDSKPAPKATEEVTHKKFISPPGPPSFPKMPPPKKL